MTNFSVSDLAIVVGAMFQMGTMVWLMLKAAATSRSIEKDVQLLRDSSIRVEALLISHENRISLLEGKMRSG